jgi:anti-anti-sigma factor
MHASFAIPKRLSFGPAAYRRPPSQSLRLRSSRSEPSVVVVSAFGDVDASNSKELACHVAQVRGPRDNVVLDLGCVDFFGVEGLSVLVQMNADRSGTTDLVVVPSPAVTRLLRLCHPRPPLLVAADIDAAVVMLLGHRRSALQLVSDSP